MEEKLKATEFDSSSNVSREAEVEDLIAGALKELDHSKPPKKKTEEKDFAATPMEVKEQKLMSSNPEPSEKQQQVQNQNKEYEDTFKKNFEVGSIIVGTIAKIDPSGALVDIGYKSDGWIDSFELSAGLKVGDRIKVMIEKLETKEGYVLISKKKADFEASWTKAYDSYKNKEVIEAKVTNAVKGGLVVDCGGIRGFLPASQVSKQNEVKLEEFVGKVLPVKIIEINRRQSKIVLSHKLGVVEHSKIEAEKIINDIEVGQIREGKVSSIKNFGAFVDLGGIDGLIPLSEMSWKRIKHPSELLKVGQKIEVFVIGVDQITKKISLGLKQLQSDPWAIAIEKYKTGQIVKVKVLRLAKFGAFAEIEEGLEGLIHLSELSKEKIQKPEDAVKIGDIVDAKILRIIPDEQKIGLSIREVQLERETELVQEQKVDENKVTIGEMLAEKERLRAEREAENSTEEPPQEQV